MGTNQGRVYTGFLLSMNLTPETMPTPIWGVRLLVVPGPNGVETYTLQVTKWKAACWLVWRYLRNTFTRLFSK